MKLSYRGASYEYNQPTLEMSEGEILGRYRGAAWRCQTLKEMPISQPSPTLKYRGVAYTPNQTSGVRPAPVAQTELARCRVPGTTGPAFKEVSRLHRANLERNLERRLQVAKQQGNQFLVDLLEAERSQLA